MTLIIKTDFTRTEDWIDAFRDALPEIESRPWDDPGDPAAVTYAFVWDPPEGAMRRFPNLKCILSG